jgi:cytoskeletal protein CcmA (bactofilin family)
MAFSLNGPRSGSQPAPSRTSLPTQGLDEGGSRLPPQRVPMEEMPSSIIGHDLELRGNDIQIIVRGKLRVDGNISGEVYGREITIGRDAQVSGKIVAEKVAIHGTVSAGVIHSRFVALMSGSNVEADIHHSELAIEEGAMFDGCSRRTPEGQQLPTPEEEG